MTEGFSNGSAYGDLDNDGDLDLVVNNVNMPCFFYENQASQVRGNSYIKIQLKGGDKNPNALGAYIIATDENGVKYHYENQPARGFQSSMDPRINMGLGKAKSISLTVIWPSGKVSSLSNVKVNQILNIDQKDASEADQQNKSITTPIWSKSSEYIQYTHEENTYVDFNRERLIYHMMSSQGPKVAHGDINGDGLQDIVVPGAKGFVTSIFIQGNDGKYKLLPPNPDMEKYKEAEHIKAMLFDADQDGDLDLYLASGGTEISEFSDLLSDLIFFNDGKGNFTDSGQKLPNNNDLVSTGDVSYGDLDGDGDMDIFLGERVKVGRYGARCSGFILINDGKGKYQDMTSKWSKELQNIGLVTSSVITDIDGDKRADLIVAGEFMSVTIFKNNGSSLTKIKENVSEDGWWNALSIADLDNDGDMDIIAVNHGLNSRFKASTDYPIKLLYGDFDANGADDPVFCKTHPDGKDYPFALRHHLMARMPSLKKKYQKFESFKNASIADIFTTDQLKNVNPLMVNELRSCVFMNEGNMKFTKIVLPSEAQFSPVYAICVRDINNDKYPDLILGGNLYGVQPEVGRYDASYGNVLINDGNAYFKDESLKYGFSVKGEIRSIINDGQKIHIFSSNSPVVSYKIPTQ
jgi:hypothetical protein